MLDWQRQKCIQLKLNYIVIFKTRRWSIRPSPPLDKFFKFLERVKRIWLQPHLNPSSMNAFCLVSCLMCESKLFKMFTSLLEKYSWVLLSLHLVWFKATLLLQIYCILLVLEKEILLLLIKIWLSGTFWLVVYHSQCLQLSEKGQQYGPPLDD